MPGTVLTVGSTVTCPHAGRAVPQPSQSRVLADGQPVTTLADLYPVTGCPFTVGTKPQPCVSIGWIAAATRVRVNGSPALLRDSTGVCRSAEQAPQGPPQVTVVQQRVVGR